MTIAKEDLSTQG